MEQWLSGYCRCMDESRLVLVEDGEPDCAYFTCPHAAACQLAAQIRRIREEEKCSCSS